ncbi:hypothetical protein [Sphingobacterium thalpophilum]
MNYLNVTSKVDGLDIHARILAKAILSIYDYDRKDRQSLIKLVYQK